MPPVAEKNVAHVNVLAAFNYRKLKWGPDRYLQAIKKPSKSSVESGDFGLRTAGNGPPQFSPCHGLPRVTPGPH
jgi:hypothetical protein